MGCSFCLTGKSGLIRNLRAWEILDQILSVNRLIKTKKNNKYRIDGHGRAYGQL